MNSDHHASDRYYDAQLALKERRHARSASTSTSSTTTAPTCSSASAPTATRSPRPWAPTGSQNLRYHLRAVLTNKCQQGAYRGFGSEVQNWVLERLIDKAAAPSSGWRRRRSAGATSSSRSSSPTRSPAGNLYDSGNYHAVLDKALG